MRKTHHTQIRLTEVTETLDGRAELGQIFKTQFGPGNLFRRLEATVKQMMSREYFALAWPVPYPGARLADLFEGLS